MERKERLNIVLVEPEIPQNTGNISRTCAVTGSALHLVGKMGFSITEKHVRRAGLDYWEDLRLFRYDSMEAFYEAHPNGEFWYFSTKVDRNFDKVSYASDAFLIFGKETAGLPRELIEANVERTVRIPMKRDQRCLNLSNAVCVALYEALRQHQYFDMV